MSGREARHAMPSALASPDVVPMVEASIAFAIQRLIADNPELLWPPDVACRRPPARIDAARAVVALAGELLDAFRWYRDVRSGES